VCSLCLTGVCRWWRRSHYEIQLTSADGSAAGATAVVATDSTNSHDTSFTFSSLLPAASSPAPRFIRGRVRAIDGGGWISEYAVSVQTKYDVYPPVTPLNLVDDHSGDGVDVVWSRRVGVSCVRYDLGSDSTAWTVSMLLGPSAGSGATALVADIPINATRPSWWCFTPASVTMTSGVTYFMTVTAKTQCSGLVASGSSNGFLFDTHAPVANLQQLELHPLVTAPLFGWVDVHAVTLLSLNSSIVGDWNVSWPHSAIHGAWFVSHVVRACNQSRTLQLARGSV
jgi:hypothetical protein